MLTDEQKIAQYQDKINRIKSKQRKNDTRQKILIGGLMVSKAKKNPDIAKQLLSWINEGISKDTDLKCLNPTITQLEQVVEQTNKDDDPLAQFMS